MGELLIEIERVFRVQGHEGGPFEVRQRRTPTMCVPFQKFKKREGGQFTVAEVDLAKERKRIDELKGDDNLNMGHEGGEQKAKFSFQLVV
ncbi:hypothetical protein TrLO_g12635 [Triparma laevis f. longispina]|uniref:Uncharacterized protein n=1 Tax=Triparma laevis f. longispina TaxID=1714387 RepID=A0A9W7F9Y5_9STRA|nr:hypothetical protein TrLO_g12635 [Triparma laevis f. longispina]